MKLRAPRNTSLRWHPNRAAERMFEAKANMGGKSSRGRAMARQGTAWNVPSTVS